MNSNVQAPPTCPVVLVADDDARVRAYISTVLRTRSVRVVEAADGVDALTVFHAYNGKVDLVITDIKMPRMTGIELAASLRSMCPSIPLIFVSGEPAPRARRDAASRFIFIEKPFAPAAMLEAFQQCLEWTLNAQSAPWPAMDGQTQPRLETSHRPTGGRG